MDLNEPWITSLELFNAWKRSYSNKCKQFMTNLNTRDPFSVLVFICAAAARSLSDKSDKDAGLTS
jgi:hypothetical protein